jgi:hypothetical protein
MSTPQMSKQEMRSERKSHLPHPELECHHPLNVSAQEEYIRAQKFIKRKESEKKNVNSIDDFLRDSGLSIPRRFKKN